MGDDRGSSGSGTMLIVVAILGGILVVGCCGGLAVIGLGGVAFWAHDVPQDMAPPVIIREEATRTLDPLKVNPEEKAEPSDPTLREVPERAPGISDPNSATVPEDSGSAGSLEKKK